MITKTKKFNQWSKPIQKKLHYASFGFEGLMLHITKKHPETLTYVIFNKKQIVGWMLIGSRKQTNAVMIYINKRYRLKGFGNSLIKKLKKDHPTKKFKAYPHDVASCALYDGARFEYQNITYNLFGNNFINYIDDWETNLYE